MFGVIDNDFINVDLFAVNKGFFFGVVSIVIKNIYSEQLGVAVSTGSYLRQLLLFNIFIATVS